MNSLWKINPVQREKGEINVGRRVEESRKEKLVETLEKGIITYGLIVNMLLSPRVMETTPSSQPVSEDEENMVSSDMRNSGHTFDISCSPTSRNWTLCEQRVMTLLKEGCCSPLGSRALLPRSKLCGRDGVG